MQTTYLYPYRELLAEVICDLDCSRKHSFANRRICDLLEKKVLDRWDVRVEIDPRTLAKQLDEWDIPRAGSRGNTVHFWIDRYTQSWLRSEFLDK